MNCKKIFIIALLLTFTSLAQAQEKIVKIATLGDYSPFCIAEEKVKHNQIIPVGNDAIGFKGYSWDVLRESFHEIGYTIHLSIYPWVRAMSSVKKGKVDILFPTGKNTERQKIFYYSDESINRVDFLVYVQTDNQIEWTGLESFKGRLIGILRGYNYGDKWLAATDIRKHEVLTVLEGFTMLSNKQLDGFLGYEINWDIFLKQKNWTTKYRKLPVFDFSEEYVVALKSNPDAKEILTAFDTGKKRLLESGKLKEITNKWFGN